MVGWEAHERRGRVAEGGAGAAGAPAIDASSNMPSKGGEVQGDIMADGELIVKCRWKVQVPAGVIVGAWRQENMASW